MPTYMDNPKKNIHLSVQKRDREIVPFDETKIITAVQKANNTVDPIRQLSSEQIAGIAKMVRQQAENADHVLTIEEIQDAVEIGIMEMRGYETAQKYIRYRYLHELERNK